MINKVYKRCHFYSVIQYITTDYNNNYTKFLNLDFNEESNNFLIKFHKEFCHIYIKKTLENYRDRFRKLNIINL